MSDRPDDRSARDVEIPADVSEADALDQARPVADEDEEDLPTSIEADEPEADALDQARPVDVEDDAEEST